MLAQNGGREDDTKDYDQVSDDECVSEDDAAKGESWVNDDLDMNNTPLGLGRSGSLTNRKLSKTGNLKNYCEIQCCWIPSD